MPVKRFFTDEERKAGAKERWTRGYYARREKILAARKAHTAANPELWRARRKADYEKHRAARIQAAIAWAKANSARRKATTVAWKRKNRRHVAEKARVYSARYKDQCYAVKMFFAAHGLTAAVKAGALDHMPTEA